MENLVLKIDQEGNVQFLYDDSLRKAFDALGDMKMRRASNIRWNEVTQMWDLFIVDEDGAESFQCDFECRGDAIDYEIGLLPRLLAQ